MFVSLSATCQWIGQSVATGDQEDAGSSPAAPVVMGV